VNRVARTAAIVGGVLGAAATGAALVLRRRMRVDPMAGEELGELAGDRTSTVVTGDGLALSAEEVDPADGGEPDVTVVYVHGFALSRRCWHFQRRDLAELVQPRVRQVFYDHRSHGRSGLADLGTSSIEQLAADLDDVLRALVPVGPIVLVGHSLGGMTVMALAEARPELFTERVLGVALVCTAAGEVGRSGLSRPLLSRYNPLTRNLVRLAEWQPGLVEFVRASGGQLTRQATRRIAFGSRDVGPRLVDFMIEMLHVTPLRALADFVETFGRHDRYAALAALSTCQVQVIAGDRDLITPFSHAERMAAELPDAELVRVPGAGHMAMLEQPELVNAHLAELVARSVNTSQLSRRRSRR